MNYGYEMVDIEKTRNIASATNPEKMLIAIDELKHNLSKEGWQALNLFIHISEELPSLMLPKFSIQKFREYLRIRKGWNRIKIDIAVKEIKGLI